MRNLHSCYYDTTERSSRYDPEDDRVDDTAGSGMSRELSGKGRASEQGSGVRTLEQEINASHSQTVDSHAQEGLAGHSTDSAAESVQDERPAVGWFRSGGGREDGGKAEGGEEREGKGREENQLRSKRV